MGALRMLSQGTADYETLRAYVSRAADEVQRNQPGTLAYECFTDEVSGQVVWHEMHADADAFLRHVENLSSSGLLEELLGFYSLAQLTALTRVTDPRVQEVLGQFGAIRSHGVGGFVR
jgi:quinol monooxygenase YgiN